MTRLPMQESIELAREAEFTLGSIHIKPASREVVVDGRPEIFEPRVLQVLVALAQRRGNVVSRDELSARCWEGRAVGEDALNRCIARIRRLAQSSGQFKVETVPRVGYRLTTEDEAGSAGATISPQPVSAPLPSPPATLERVPGTPVRRRAALFAGLAILVVAGAVGAYFLWRNSRVIEVSIGDHDVIVLPFKALNEDADTRNFAQSVTASIVNVLSRSGKKVISPAKAEKFRGAERAHAAVETGARYIIDGEVRREDQVIRIVVRVDDGRTGRTLMSKDFEGDWRASAQLADVVGGHIGMRAWAFSMRDVGSGNEEVVDAAFRARELSANGEARAAYDLAVAMARKYPDDPRALLMLAINTNFNYWSMTPEEVAPAMRAARVAAERVSSLAPDIGDNYFALSGLVPPHRWALRERYLRKGYAIQPEAPGVGIVLANFLTQVGRYRDAEILARGVLGRDPFNRAKTDSHFIMLKMLGDDVGAAEVARFVDRYWPADPGFAMQRFLAADFRGDAAEAANMMRDPVLVAMVEPEDSQPVIRRMLHALATRQPGDIDAADKSCSTGWISYQTSWVCLLGISELGRIDDAFLLAFNLFPDKRANSEARDEELWLLRTQVLFDTTLLYRAELAPMRADARFTELVDGIGLLGYWRTGHPPDFCQTERVPVCDALRADRGK